MARKHRRKPPRTHVTAERYIIANGTPQAVVTNCLIIKPGNCPAATVTNPHMRGDQPTTCDACYAVA